MKTRTVTSFAIILVFLLSCNSGNSSSEDSTNNPITACGKISGFVTINTEGYGVGSIGGGTCFTGTPIVKIEVIGTNQVFSSIGGWDWDCDNVGQNNKTCTGYFEIGDFGCNDIAADCEIYGGLMQGTYSLRFYDGSFECSPINCNGNYEIIYLAEKIVNSIGSSPIVVNSNSTTSIGEVVLYPQ